MIEYQPPYKITDKMMSYVSSISEKIGRISVRSDFEAKPHLRKNNKIMSVYSSLKIEANSLSLNAVKDVIAGKTVLGTMREIQEVKNAYQCYDEILNINPYNIEELKRFHGIMTQYLEEEAGCFRRGEEGVFNGNTCIFMAPPARFVPEQMEALFSWMYQNKDTVHPLILSAVFHYEFVFIHPFTDGNGRMARLWHTAILAKWKQVFAYIPVESQIEKFQEGYYNAISSCHAIGNSNVFIEFMLKQIDTILDEISEQSNLPDEDQSEYVKKLLNVMEQNVPYTAKAILDLLGLKSKETLRINYLHPAIEQGYVRMTLPEKPRSRNQRYIKV